MKNNSFLQSLCMYRAFCIVYHLDRPMHNIHFNNEFLYRKYFMSWCISV